MHTPTPFSKILVANRGEIALRVIRTARTLGYRTVAVYASADERAAHVAAADQAVWIGDSLPAQSYLRIDALLDAARATGADAVHPGYGFLAENEDFAAACRAAGLVFVGPSPEAIRSMGDKAGAKRIMIAAGVPCIPGYEDEDQSPERLAAEAQRIGFPVMIKATAGGGGRGMRLVPSAGDFADLLVSARSEARHAFGDDRVILERAIVEPRHVEVQVFADRHGNAVHLGERDCSVQRRHQKVIEEAPSPAVDAALRERMGRTAVEAVRSIGYEGAGTLEFLVDPSGRYYFMEMNTRLQVEHPVTEAITGLDLVEWQLRIAAGEPLPLQQEHIAFEGHAIEVRLCAEDVPAGFMPQSGTMRRWQAPPELRVDTALHAHAPIPPYYDSMIAKLVAHGRTREEARRKLLRGLQDTVALGVRTNQDFLCRCLAHPTFAAGAASTAFIAQHRDTLLLADATAVAKAIAVAAWLLLATEPAAPPATPQPHGLTSTVPWHPRFALDGTEHTAIIERIRPQAFEVTVDGRMHRLQVVAVGEQEMRIVVDSVMERIAFDRDGASLWFRHAGLSHAVEDHSHTATARHGHARDGRVLAAMNGRVVAVMAAVGERVSAGQPLVTLEAMKMEHVHRATISGTLLALHVDPGDQVQARRLVAQIAPEAAS